MAISPIPLTRHTLLFPGRLRRIIERSGAVAYPHEMCGLLIGASDGTTTFVEEVTHAQNLDSGHTDERYALAPDDFDRARRIAAENGLEVVGIWRSRPNDGAVPSQDDLAEALSQTASGADSTASSANYSYVIVSVAADHGVETRSWRLDGDGFVEEDMQS